MLFLHFSLQYQFVTEVPRLVLWIRLGRKSLLIFRFIPSVLKMSPRYRKTALLKCFSMTKRDNWEEEGSGEKEEEQVVEGGEGRVGFTVKDVNQEANPAECEQQVTPQ